MEYTVDILAQTRRDRDEWKRRAEENLKLLAEARGILLDVGDGEYGTEYDGQTITCCLGCSYQDNHSNPKHKKECPFERAKESLSRIDSALKQEKP